jgi:hypothetical protein
MLGAESADEFAALDPEGNDILDNLHIAVPTVRRYLVPVKEAALLLRRG